MSLWETKPWSNFLWPSLRTHLIRQNKTPRDLRHIHNTGNSCRDTLPSQYGTKAISVFLPVDEEASWWLLLNLVSLLWGSTVQPENTYSCILKVTGQVWESQKRISINTNHSYHQRSSLLASLNWSNNKVRFSFNQPNRKRLGAKLVNVKCLPHKAFVLWQKGWSTKAKEAHPPREVRLTLLDTNPVF